MDLAEHYLADTRQRMRGVKALGDGALTQLLPDQWHLSLSDEGNSAAILTQHLSGNMQSRWGALRQGYAQAEGESVTRKRDAEFVESTQSCAELLALWEEGWQVFFEALNNLQPNDLTRTLTIRSEKHTVLEAIQRQVAHYSGHVYQLVFLVKTLRGAEFSTLSIARGDSATYNSLLMTQR